MPGPQVPWVEEWTVPVMVAVVRSAQKTTAVHVTSSLDLRTGYDVTFHS